MTRKKFIVFSLLALCLLAYLGKGRIGAMYWGYKYKKKCEQLNVHQVEFNDTAKSIPTLSITTENGTGAELIDRTYQHVTLSVAEDSCVANIPIKIKKRGNSTAMVPKAPYTIKLDKKRELCGLKRAKKYVLLANSFDRSLMNTSVALEFARELDLQYTPHTTPVNLVVDGQYRGLYDLCEKVGIGQSSVDIDKDTEALFILDVNMKEQFGFYSNVFNFPVGIKESSLDKADTTDVEKVNFVKGQWIDRFERFENAIQHCIDSGAQDSIVDWQSLTDYLLVYIFTRNADINHPKSVYLYTTNGGEVFHFGPVWDFDLAFGNHWMHFESRVDVTTRFWYDMPNKSMACLRKLSERHEIKALLNERWQWWKENKQDDFWRYFDEHARKIRPYYVLNSQTWPFMGFPEWCGNDCIIATPTDFASQVEELRQWIIDRIDYMDVQFGTSE